MTGIECIGFIEWTRGLDSDFVGDSTQCPVLLGIFTHIASEFSYASLASVMTHAICGCTYSSSTQFLGNPRGDLCEWEFFRALGAYYIIEIAPFATLHRVRLLRFSSSPTP